MTLTLKRFSCFTQGSFEVHRVRRKRQSAAVAAMQWRLLLPVMPSLLTSATVPPKLTPPLPPPLPQRVNRRRARTDSQPSPPCPPLTPPPPPSPPPPPLPTPNNLVICSLDFEKYYPSLDDCAEIVAEEWLKSGLDIEVDTALWSLAFTWPLSVTARSSSAGTSGT